MIEAFLLLKIKFREISIIKNVVGEFATAHHGYLGKARFSHFTWNIFLDDFFNFIKYISFFQFFDGV